VIAVNSWLGRSADAAGCLNGPPADAGHPTAQARTKRVSPVNGHLLPPRLTFPIAPTSGLASLCNFAVRWCLLCYVVWVRNVNKTCSGLAQPGVRKVEAGAPWAVGSATRAWNFCGVHSVTKKLKTSVLSNAGQEMSIGRMLCGRGVKAGSLIPYSDGKCAENYHKLYSIFFLNCSQHFGNFKP